ncbi:MULTISPECIES: hypothetical protein [Novosphingobium]|jgi:hypothetical protein|uniref:hypothetical protein n=1 Tax=Novosphingobium TaxID=165696 RepID=UPI0022F2651C|nr:MULTISPECIES: hypothetical protein [Novosphingobium]GLK45120.1 hypothetical protein GCM10017612_30400 [Novosphingobium resinovorum]
MKLTVMRALSLAGVLVLAGCLETMPGPDRPHRPRPEKPAICTREYMPVCAEKRRHRQTFSNACMAKAEGFRVIASGECRR